MLEAFAFNMYECGVVFFWVMALFNVASFRGTTNSRKVSEAAFRNGVWVVGVFLQLLARVCAMP